MSNPHRATIYDVAAKAGVSISTVSRVLNAPHKVNGKTRTRVMAAIDSMGFVPREQAVARARRHLGRIGVLTPFFTTPSLVERMRGIAAALVDTAYELVIYPVDSQDRLDGYLGQLPTTKQIDGLIIMSLPVSAVATKRLLDSGIAIVTMDIPNTPFTSISTHDKHGGSLAAQHLVARGHRRIAFFDYGGHDSFYINHGPDRLQGFEAALEELGIDLMPTYIRHVDIHESDNIGEHITQLLKLPQPPTAIFATADSLALRILRVARQQQIHIPDQLAVIGYDNIEFASFIGLTTVDQSIQESGTMAANLVMQQLVEGAPHKKTTSTHIALSVIQRETT